MVIALLGTQLEEWKRQLSIWAQNGALTRAALDALELISVPEQLGELVQQWSRSEFADLPPVVLLPGTAM
ncbi:MAG: hypothetical protein ACKOPT_11570, partial [Cyanobium sp.]